MEYLYFNRIPIELKALIGINVKSVKDLEKYCDLLSLKNDLEYWKYINIFFGGILMLGNGTNY